MAATFHSGKYLFGLASGVAVTPGVSLFEHARAVRITDADDGEDGSVSVTTAGGQVVVARASP